MKIGVRNRIGRSPATVDRSWRPTACRLAVNGRRNRGFVLSCRLIKPLSLKTRLSFRSLFWLLAVFGATLLQGCSGDDDNKFGAVNKLTFKGHDKHELAVRPAESFCWDHPEYGFSVMTAGPDESRLAFLTFNGPFEIGKEYVQGIDFTYSIEIKLQKSAYAPLEGARLTVHELEFGTDRGDGTSHIASLKAKVNLKMMYVNLSDPSSRADEVSCEILINIEQ
jgi:hypothetical protein